MLSFLNNISVHTVLPSSSTMTPTTLSTMIELLSKEVEKEVNVDFNEVFQRMTLDAIGQHIFGLDNIAYRSAYTLIHKGCLNSNSISTVTLTSFSL